MTYTITAKPQGTDSLHSKGIEFEVPPNMETSLRAIKEVCDTMFGIQLETIGKPKLFSAEGMEYGVGLSLLHDGGSWELGLFGSKESSDNLARAFLGFGADEKPPSSEVLDLLGEIVNMVSGIVKRSIPGGEQINFGVPLHLIADDCKTYLPHKIPVIAQSLSGPSFEGEILLVLSDRNPITLATEISGVLNDATPGNTQLLGRVIALFEELEECLGKAGTDQISKTIDNCSSIIMSLINEEINDGDAALQWVRTSVSELSSALSERQAHLYNAHTTVPDFKSTQEEKQPTEQVSVERDDETLEIITDFLQESEDGLNNADQILMRLESGVDDQDGINALFRVFHSIKGLSSFLEITDVTNLGHTTETLLDLARDGKIKLIGTPLDIVFEATEMMRQQLKSVRRSIEKKLSFPETVGLPKLLLRLEAVIKGEDIPDPEVLVTQQAPEPAQSPPPSVKETVKVDLELVNRLAMISASFSKIEPILKNLKSSELSEEIHKDLISTCAELQEVSTFMRMVPIQTLFQKMTRMVRDLSKKTGKLARLTLSGEDTLFARNMIEKLNDPLVHMIRNAVDHGIEETEARKTTGKPPLGAVQLIARCEEINEKKQAIIELKDDGKGLNPKILIEKAVTKGILEPDAELTDEEAFKLIFAAGFSTAANVTAISGRGVGMDVVRTNIENLGGEISITSKVGTGSAFKITLPWGI